VFVWSGQRCVGVLTFAEDPRPDAIAALTELRDRLAVSVGVLSGDSSARSAAALAVQGVTMETGMSPDDKLRRVQAATEEGRRSGGGVMFVGDGVNDAPALA